jgi:hypothetical protein
MIQLVNTLKTVISDNILLKEQNDNSSKVDEYMTNFLSNLTKIKDSDGFIYATKDNKNLVIIEDADYLYINKKFYDDFPDFVKDGFGGWVYKLWKKYGIHEFPGSKNVLYYLKIRKPVNTYLTLTFQDLEVYKEDDEIHFINIKENRTVVILLNNEAWIDGNIYDNLASVLSLNEDYQKRIAFINWFYDVYNFNVDSVKKMISGPADEIIYQGEKIGLVKDKINN